MGFPQGTISFRRFKVIAAVANTPNQSLLDKLASNALKPSDLGFPEEMEYGWSGGQHVLDGNFSFDSNVFADCIHCALRIDTNKFPAALKKAMEKVEEAATAAGNPSGFISKAQRRDCRESVRKQIEVELRTGKYRRTRLVPVLWDLAAGVLYANASGATLEKLAELFERTFGGSLESVTSGSMAAASMGSREFDDLRATRFVSGPDGEGQMPDYPWVAKGAGPRDYLGNEFLLWLWYQAEHKSGVIGHATVYIDRLLEVECAYGHTGKDTIKGDGPARKPEAREALRIGKVPRKMGMILDANRSQFSLTLGAELLAVSGARLPEIEDAELPRVVFEERIAALRDLGRTVDTMFAAFLADRREGWEATAESIGDWINSFAATELTV